MLRMHGATKTHCASQSGFCNHLLGRSTNTCCAFRMADGRTMDLVSDKNGPRRCVECIDAQEDTEAIRELARDGIRSQADYDESNTHQCYLALAESLGLE